MRVKKSVVPIALGLLMTAGTVAFAQVGYPPAASPYRDLEHAQEFTLLVGQFHAHTDPANVAPRSGLLIGGHYEWRAGGPAYLIAEVSHISSDRRLINPSKFGTARELGTESRALYAANVGLGLGLTGAKTWHNLAPEVAGGVGLVSDFHTPADTLGFKFGTRFALNLGAGIRYVPGGSWQVRLDVNDRLYTIGYPDAYYVAPVGGTAVAALPKGSFWTNNPAFTFGISRLF
jgi:hypothetical protein